MKIGLRTLMTTMAILITLTPVAIGVESSQANSKPSLQRSSLRLMRINKKVLLSAKELLLQAPKFDQGTFQPPQITPVVPATEPGTSKADVQKPLPATGVAPVTRGNLGGYLRSNQYLQQASALIADANFDYLEPLQKDLFRAEYGKLSAERDGMLPEADGLDTEDAAFVTEYNGLEETRKQLEAEIKDYNGQVDYHNGICNPAPDEETYQWCLKDHARLDIWKAQLETKIDDYNKKVDDYNKRHDVFSAHWDKFVAAIVAWENRVKQLIDSIQKALQQLQDCIYRGGTSEIIATDPVQSKITCKYSCCGRETVNYRFMNGVPTQEQIDYICTNPLPRCSPGEAKSAHRCHPAKNAGREAPQNAPAQPTTDMPARN